MITLCSTPLTPNRLQLLLDKAHSFPDGLRLVNKLIRTKAAVFVTDARSPAATHGAGDADDALVSASSIVVLLERSDYLGSSSFSLFCPPSQVQDLAAVCKALVELHPSTTSFKFAGLQACVAAAVREAFISQRFALLYEEPCSRMSLKTLPASVSALPDDYCLRALTPEDAQLVNDTWAYESSDSIQLVSDMIASNCHSCARLRATGQAVCWVLEYSDASIGMLFTVPEHRRRGLARTCVLDICRTLLKQQGRTEVYGFVTRDNRASFAMLESAGFAPSGQFMWCGFRSPAASAS